jgi:hypothetical protein
MEEYEVLPKAESHRLIDFERAEILTLESFPPQFVLTVSGKKPYMNMEVSLEPLVYIRQPEYWGSRLWGICPVGSGYPS